MKKLFIAVMLFTLASCYEPNVKNVRTGHYVGTFGRPIGIITIDKCQYLFGDWGSASILTHKGNCNNPIHKSKSE